MSKPEMATELAERLLFSLGRAIVAGAVEKTVKAFILFWAGKRRVADISAQAIRAFRKACRTHRGGRHLIGKGECVCGVSTLHVSNAAYGLFDAGPATNESTCRLFCMWKFLGSNSCPITIPFAFRFSGVRLDLPNWVILCCNGCYPSALPPPSYRSLLPH